MGRNTYIDRRGCTGCDLADY